MKKAQKRIIRGKAEDRKEVDDAIRRETLKSNTTTGCASYQEEDDERERGRERASSNFYLDLTRNGLSVVLSREKK